MNTTLRNIVIVGGGVGGLELATRLGKKIGKNKKAKIILIDQNHNHVWKPLLHEVASGSLDENVDGLSYLEHAYNYYFKFQLGSITNVNCKDKTLTLAELRDEKDVVILPERNLSYDTLVMALGSISNDFNIPGVKEHCIFLDNLNQARKFHKKLLNLFMRCSKNSNNNNTINIVIVGGGATGVELSAEIYSAAKQLHKYDYNSLTDNFTNVSSLLNITLIELSKRILPSLPPQISTITHSFLTKLGIQIMTQTTVIKVDKGGLHTKSSEYIKADLIVWAAGIKAPDFIKNISYLETNHINQLVVNRTLQTTYDPNIFAIGDCSSCFSSEGKLVPPRAQAAHQMAALAFHNIEAQMKNRPLKEYFYKDYGSLISLSDCYACGNLICDLIHNSLVIEGWIARFICNLIYRMHQATLHGYFKTGLISIVHSINKILHPRFKLY